MLRKLCRLRLSFKGSTSTSSQLASRFSMNKKKTHTHTILLLCSCCCFTLITFCCRASSPAQLSVQARDDEEQALFTSPKILSLTGVQGSSFGSSSGRAAAHSLSQKSLRLVCPVLDLRPTRVFIRPGPKFESVLATAGRPLVLKQFFLFFSHLAFQSKLNLHKQMESTYKARTPCTKALGKLKLPKTSDLLKRQAARTRMSSKLKVP